MTVHEKDYSRPHYVYRYYAEDGELLYIGCTFRRTGRGGEHMNKAPWFPRVASVTHTCFPDRDTARGAERIAIATEWPTHNAMRYRWVWAELNPEASWPFPSYFDMPQRVSA